MLAADRICSKRLKPVVPVLLPALERHGRLVLSAEVRNGLLAISPASMDRLLIEVRLVSRGGRRRRAGSARRCGGRFPFAPRQGLMISAPKCMRREPSIPVMNNSRASAAAPAKSTMARFGMMSGLTASARREGLGLTAPRRSAKMATAKAPLRLGNRRGSALSHRCPRWPRAGRWRRHRRQ